MYECIAVPVHTAEADAWLRITSFSQHLVQVKKRNVQELYVLAACFSKASITNILTNITEECVLALAHTVAALIKRLSCWATAYHAQQCTSHRDLELLNRYECSHIDSHLFTVPANSTTVDTYVEEWVRCCIFCTH
jgi:hypothetical protein